ncbi:hypothetical protein ACOMHN_020420 [Nucella lapillus]
MAPHPPPTAPSQSQAEGGGGGENKTPRESTTQNSGKPAKGGPPPQPSSLLLQPPNPGRPSYAAPPAPPRASQAPPRSSLRSSQHAQRSPGRGSCAPSPPGGDPRRKGGQQGSPEQTPGQFGADASSEQVASPPLSSQSSDQVSSRTQVSKGVGPSVGAGAREGGNADASRPHSEGNSKSSGVAVEGRTIPPPMLAPLPNAPKLPVRDLFTPSEDPIREHRKKKKKGGRFGRGGGGGPPPPPSSQEKERGGRGFAAPLHHQHGRERGHSAAVPAPKYSRGHPQHSDARYMDDTPAEEPPTISGFAVPIREGTAKSSSRPPHRSLPSDPDPAMGPSGDGFTTTTGYHGDRVGESIAEEDELGELMAMSGPFIPPPQGFRGSSQHGSRPVSQSMPQSLDPGFVGKEKSGLKMAPTSAKPPLPRSHHNSASVSRRSSEKDASPRRWSRPPTSRH